MPILLTMLIQSLSHPQDVLLVMSTLLSGILTFQISDVCIS